MMNVVITIEIEGKDVVLTLRAAKILYNNLNKALHGKELNR